MNMSSVITPKSDQLNADDMIAGPITIKITEVKINGGTEQPVSIHYEGDKGKPYKSCKSMNRVLVAAWGPDARQYTGRSLTLFRDPTVKWAGMEVGGIRISHMSHIDKDMVMALTASKGSRKPFTVRPLAALSAPRPPMPMDDLVQESRNAAQRGVASLTEFWKSLSKDQRASMATIKDAELKPIAEAADVVSKTTENF